LAKQVRDAYPKDGESPKYGDRLRNPSIPKQQIMNRMRDYVACPRISQPHNELAMLGLKLRQGSSSIDQDERKLYPNLQGPCCSQDIDSEVDVIALIKSGREGIKVEAKEAGSGA
jgi:hypothetical protein